MKFPSHILLDVSKPLVAYSTQYWIIRYLIATSKNQLFLNNLHLHRRFWWRKDKFFKNDLFRNQKKYTIRYNYSNPALFMSKEHLDFYEKVFKTRYKVKHRDDDSRHEGKEVYDFITKPNMQVDEKALRRLIKNFKYSPKNTPIFKAANLWNLFDINFLRKEKIYTKLKYSRVPQYDIVSGGSALLLAGFLGFLICEKFGFELGDSGDFYYLFMYLVIICFSLRIYLKLIESENFSWNLLSLKWLINFYMTIFSLFINFFKNLIKR